MKKKINPVIKIMYAACIELGKKYTKILIISQYGIMFFLVLFCIFQIVMLGLLTFLIRKIKKTFSVLFLSETGAVVDPALLSVKILWPSTG